MRFRIAGWAKPNAPESDRVKAAFTLLAGGVPVAVAVAGLVGLTSDGNLGRVMASHGGLFGIAVLLIVLAVFFGSAGFFAGGYQRLMAFFGVLLLAGGVILLVVLQVNITASPDAPTVTLSIKRSDTGLTATTTVAAGEIAASRYVSVRIFGSRAALTSALPPLRPTSSPDGSVWDYHVETIYDSFLGPSPRGDLNISFETPFLDQYTQVTVIAEYVENVDGIEALPDALATSVQPKPVMGTQPPQFDCGALNGERGCATTSLIQLYAPK